MGREEGRRDREGVSAKGGKGLKTPPQGHATLPGVTGTENGVGGLWPTPWLPAPPYVSLLSCRLGLATRRTLELALACGRRLCVCVWTEDQGCTES